MSGRRGLLSARARGKGAARARGKGRGRGKTRRAKTDGKRGAPRSDAGSACFSEILVRAGSALSGRGCGSRGLLRTSFGGAPERGRVHPVTFYNKENGKDAGGARHAGRSPYSMLFLTASATSAASLSSCSAEGLYAILTAGSSASALHPASISYTCCGDWPPQP